jgi:thioredoxin-related protein
MYKLISLIVILWQVSNVSYGQSIHFETSWNAAKNKAKEEGKYIFVDCYATWCAPCKQMDREVYTADLVGKYVNARFVSIKIQLDTAKADDEATRQLYATAAELQRHFSINTLPTYLFFSSDGRVVHRGQGYKTPEEFIKLCAKATDSLTQYYTLLDKYDQGIKDYSYYPYLCSLSSEFGNHSLAAVLGTEYKTNYLDRLPLDSFATTENLEFINQYAVNTVHSGDQFFRLCYNYPEKVAALTDTQFANFWVNKVITTEIVDSELWTSSGKPLAIRPKWDRLMRQIAKKYPKADAKAIIINAQLDYYEKTENRKQHTKVFINKVQTYGIASLGITPANTIQMVMMKTNDKKALAKAIDWLKILIQNTDSARRPDIYGNLAGVLYKAGRNREAIDYMKKNLLYWEQSIIPAMGKTAQEVEVYQAKLDLLDKMKKGEKISGRWNLQYFF